MDVYLMRHPARLSAKNFCIGQTDVSLSAEGSASLPALSDTAIRVRPTQIFSSDLQRCRVLAETIADQLHLDLTVESKWRELNFGLWENRNWDDIRQEDEAAFTTWMNDFVDTAPPAGESFRQLQIRALAALAESSTAGSSILLVVTHAGIIRSLISAFSNLPLAEAINIPVPYGSLTHLQQEQKSWKVISP